MNKLKNPRAAASQFYPLFARDLRSTSINCRFLSTKAMEKERFTELKGLDHPDRRTDLYHRLRIGPIKKLYKYITPTATSLAGGSPMDSTFPFSGVTVQLKEPGDQFSLENSKGLKLNYHRGDGIPPMKEWVVNHIKSVHNPPVEFDVCPTVGSTDALTKTMMLLKTDYVMFDQYAYGAAVNTCYVLGRKTAGVPVDEFGMIPDKLVESVLTLRQAGHTVNAVYLCPIGQNPMGFTMTENRKQELYKACQELDLVIIEDGMSFHFRSSPFS
jgi:DNA-binding transcriptional MocR family regulator